MHGPRRVAGEEAGADVGPPGDGGQAEVRLHVAVDVAEALGRERRPRGEQGAQSPEGEGLARAHVRLLGGGQDRRARAVGDALAEHTRPGRTRRGVLEVTVRNSTVMQELVFQKTELIQILTDRLPDAKISDLRFRVGVID